MYRNRVIQVISNLRNCNSGTEVHEVGNMRHLGNLLLELLDCDTAIKVDVDQVVKNLETQQVEFFRKKFQHLKK